MPKELTLRRKQNLFVRLVAKLIIFANENGYELSFGETYRSPHEAARLAKLGQGTVNSLHCFKLAVDFNLFKGSTYYTSSESHRPLGEYWESLHPLCRWGGRFGDGNHYSMEHEGRK